MEKSTTEEIRERFDKDVERFSNLETGQKATIDAPLSMELITQAALAINSQPNTLLDIGCGAGNNTLKLLQTYSQVNCDLVDLSQPMLDRAKTRIGEICRGEVRTFQGDFRNLELPLDHYDVIFAAAVLHHLRDDRDWKQSFRKIFDLTAPGGSVWITDLVTQKNSKIHQLMWTRYGEYLASIGGEEYRDHVFEYIEKEDSPRSLTEQVSLLQEVGYQEVEILHKNSCFAAFGAIKATRLASQS